MKETSFIEQNKEKWNRFEKLSESETRDPGELSDLYMDITDDLSYAQTFYKRRTVRVYLNQLAQRVYTGVHIQKGESFRKFFHVWKVSLPLEIYRARKNLLFALVVFLIWAALGAVTTHFYPEFSKLTSSDDYVRMTNNNIIEANPLGVYSVEGSMQMTQFKMFVEITTNNIQVAFLTFIFGIFFTIGTHFFLFKNGLMLGSFQYFFASKGLLITSFLGIWIHGAFEISAIVLAGGAGITMGNGWLFPGNYTRLQSIQLSAKSGLKIMLSLVPFFIAAGYLESYVTKNNQDLPEWSKWAVIGLSFAIILFYYVIYPMHIARKYPELLVQKDVVNYTPPLKFDLHKIRTFGQIVSDTFRLYSMCFSKIFKVNFNLILPVALIMIYFQNQLHADLLKTDHWYDWAAQFEIMFGFGMTSAQDFVAGFVFSVLFSGMFVSVLYAFNTLDEKFSWKGFFDYARKKILAVWVGNTILFFALFLIPWYWYIVLILLLPFVFLNGIVPGISDLGFGASFKKGWKYSARSYGFSLLNIVLFTLIFALLFQPVAYVGSMPNALPPSFLSTFLMPDLVDLLTDFVKNVAEAFGADRMYWANISRQLVYLMFLIAVLPLWMISMVFLAYNEHEKETATGLKEAFKKFGKRSRYQESEVDFE